MRIPHLDSGRQMRGGQCQVLAPLAAQARARVEERFTVNRMVCDTLRLYQRLLPW